MPLQSNATAVEQQAPVETSVWSAIRVEAADLAVREPMLRHLLAAQVTEATTDADIVALVLAARLSTADIDKVEMADLIRSTLNDAIMADVEADLVAVRTRDPACTTYLHALLNLKGFQALESHRIAHALWTAGRVEIASWLANLASRVFGPDIHPAAKIGGSIMLDHGSGIVIGETAVI